MAWLTVHKDIGGPETSFSNVATNRPSLEIGALLASYAEDSVLN